MAERYERPPRSCRFWFDSKSCQTNDFKIDIHSFPVWRSALKGQCEEQAGKFTCAVGKNTWRDFPILMWQTEGRQLLSELV